MDAKISRQTLGDLLRRSRKRYPSKMAIRCGKTEWTYAQFDEICNAFAAGLATEDIQIGDRVAVISRNSHAFAALRFAVARLGAVLVPINFMLSAAEAQYVLLHSGAKLLCVDSGNANLGLEAAKDTSVKSFVWLPSEGPSEPVEGMLTFDGLCKCKQAPERSIDGRMPAQLIYTSGTESRPKGALLTHEAVISEYVTSLVDTEVAAEDTLLHALPLYHCAQLDCFLGPAVYAGASNVITGAPSAENILQLAEKNKISSFFAPPTIWISLLRSPDFDKSDLSNLRKGYYGASIMPVAVLKEIQQRLPSVRLWNLYGQTEMAPIATVLKPEDQLRKAGSAGRPAINVETRVVDDDMNDMKPGEIGEIVHRSPQLMTCYYNDPERTAAAFDGDWFHSGDLGIFDDEGYLTVVDRKKDMIKTGGENVASREVEEFLYRIPQISEVAVIGLPDPKWIEAVTAIVVLKAGQTLTEDELFSACAGKLAQFKIPKRVFFIDALPKNPSGKVVKRDLRVKYAQPH